MRKKRNPKIREHVKQRDGRCVGCGRVEGLDAHHLDSWGAHGEDNPDRMVTLCRICHSKVHNGDQVMKQRIEEHLQRVTQLNWVTDTTAISWQEIV